MWSDRYYYLNIYKDEQLSDNCDTWDLMLFLAGIPELQRKDIYSFSNKEPFPFTDLQLLKLESLTGWTDLDVDAKHTNLIAIVCRKGEGVDFGEMKRVFIRIASFLDWKLVDEHTDDGIENFTLWEPGE